MKKLISVLLLICILSAFLTSCGPETENPDVDDNLSTTDLSQNTLKLAYSKNDSLNPLIAETVINTQIAGLVFDGLFKLDKGYEPKPVIAKSFVIGSSMVTVTVNDVKFSDGSDVTVEDIIFSFNAAKTSAAYEKQLSNIKSVNIGSSNSVIFNLETPDPYVLSCLDYPVIKQKSNADMPIGAGRYSYQKDGVNVYLVVNQYKTMFKPVYRTIFLEAVHDSDSFQSSLVIGNTSFYYNDLSDGTYSRLNAKNVDMGINNLVYVGFNCNDSFFSDSRARLAVSYAIDRETIAKSAFRSHARAASTPFNPDWYVIDNSVKPVKQDFERAKALLKEAEIEPKTREVTILYNSENEFKSEAAEMIEESLEEIGFIVRLKGYNPEAYMYDIKSGAFDMYIGEVKLTDNMDLSPIFSGDSSYGINEFYDSVLRYNDFKAGNCELMDFLNSFATDMPVVPVCYRNAVVTYTKSMQCDFKCCDNDVFYDIETWSIK
ncbi:MAG: ABC transporter substrate-binding protein [Clostridia bacterium]|nr:ABC transporter substrate-binding protein [Clostridia bacterium]